MRGDAVLPYSHSCICKAFHGSDINFLFPFSVYIFIYPYVHHFCTCFLASDLSADLSPYIVSGGTSYTVTKDILSFTPSTRIHVKPTNGRDTCVLLSREQWRASQSLFFHSAASVGFVCIEETKEALALYGRQQKKYGKKKRLGIISSDGIGENARLYAEKRLPFHQTYAKI